jgi:PadR family transcriptional regulator, regulatory protein PadR
LLDSQSRKYPTNRHSEATNAPWIAGSRKYSLDSGIVPAVQYIAYPYMDPTPSHTEWKKGSAEMLILSLVEARPRHGYEISKLIEQRSGGAVRFYVASLYPLLYRLEGRGWIEGRWVEKSGQRRRRYYRLTRQGRRVLASQLRGWREFVAGINRITEAENA